MTAPERHSTSLTMFGCAVCRVVQDGRNIYVVQELCCGGDLADLMTVRQHTQLILLTQGLGVMVLCPWGTWFSYGPCNALRQ